MASLGMEEGDRTGIQVEGEGNIELEGEAAQIEADPLPV